MAKTIRHEFDKYLTYDNLMKAHLLSRKGKNYKKEVILFNLKQEEYIRWLYEQLKNGTYTHGGYRIFYIQYPKKRKIEASRYIDRIVHRWIVDSFLNRYFVNQFIDTSYACIKNRGMHKASIDVQNTMKHCKRIWQNYYILKMVIRKYFQNIDKDILMNILKRKVKEEKLVKLLEKIKNYLKIKLELELNDKTQIFKSDQGVNFCGYKINEYRLKLRDRGKKAIKQKVRYLKEEVQKGNMNSKEASRFICGHLGYMKYANTRNLEEKLFYIN